MNLRLIVLTAPEFLPGEAAVLTALLDRGLDRLHLRKPHCTEQELASLIAALPAASRSRITLHDHFALQQRYGLGGIHLNRRNPDMPTRFKGLVSRSCHSLQEAADCRKQADYLFLSPIFDSISKQGYQSGFSAEQLWTAARAGIIGPTIVALGGVSAENLPTVRTLGFGGAAFLGDLWSRYHTPDDTEKVLRHFDTLLQAARS